VSRRLYAIATALIALAAFFLLGRGLGDSPDQPWLLAVEQTWVGHAALLAWWLTWLGYVFVLAPACAALIVIAIRFPQWRPHVIFSIVAMLLAWQGADFFQHFFARPRRLDWIVKHETAFSYPSSHAAIATAFYLLWSLFIARSDLAGRAWLALLLALLGFGIFWARLALGAHYLTDVLGGALWGVAVVGVLTALWPTNVFEGRKEPSLE
jgi:membrane-associated phospholipid phosphatase